MAMIYLVVSGNHSDDLFVSVGMLSHLLLPGEQILRNPPINLGILNSSGGGVLDIIRKCLRKLFPLIWSVAIFPQEKYVALGFTQT